MKRSIALVGLIAASAATAACQRAEASSDQPAAPPQVPAPAPDRLMPRGPETRERIRPGRIKCSEPVASIPC
jgi:hypothetical protein